MRLRLLVGNEAPSLERLRSRLAGTVTLTQTSTSTETVGLYGCRAFMNGRMRGIAHADSSTGSGFADPA
jgi:hypothetical protein